MPSDWLTGLDVVDLGAGISVGAGFALIAFQPAPHATAVFGVGLGMILGHYISADDDGVETGDPDAGVDSDSADENLETDGGAVTRETPETAATEQPTVLDVEVSGDRVLASVERGDVSIVVEAPAGIPAAELEAALEDVPERIDRTAELFTGGDR
ncbi:hypothetical protein GWK26_08740 [haloarchaeon 3A1-DGR]|nr:hypothetical protein GWK26_08740 [haloarchaeon 3A1-DGR]